MTVKIAIADDSPILARALAQALEEGLELTPGAAMPMSIAGPRQVREMAPDILILDPLHINQLDQLVPQWRVDNADIRLVALATRPTLDLARFCVNLGFRGFLPKSAEAVTLVRAVEVVAKGGSFIDRAFGRKLLTSEKSAYRPLTQREKDVLQRTALGLSNREVAEDLGLSPKTVDTHRARGMTKLGLSGRAALVRFAAANGWLV